MPTIYKAIQQQGLHNIILMWHCINIFPLFNCLVITDSTCVFVWHSCLVEPEHLTYVSLYQLLHNCIGTVTVRFLMHLGRSH